ncbi:LAMI_0D08042g1_1 [Lachancea mirantina]|uniref:Ataxin-10 homolog n=1 Tax=Lachancea mirantina TaxID=1230905 RepID=A0A1G4JCS2_9SACH|nr:LAMI_0D08042g1_1 [Lachancea mirantina]
MLGHEIQDLKRISTWFRDLPGEKGFDEVLSSLNRMVITSSQDEVYRAKLAGQEEIWINIGNCLDEFSEAVTSIPEIKDCSVRIVRGIVLLARNLAVHDKKITQELSIVTKSINTFNNLAAVSSHSDMKAALYLTMLEFFCNAFKSVPDVTEVDFNNLTLFLLYPLEEDMDISREERFLVLLNILASQENSLSRMLKSGDSLDVFSTVIVREILLKTLEISASNDHSAHQNFPSRTLLAISVFKKFVCHESFAIYILSLQANDEQRLLNYLKASQLVLTSTSDWNNHELTGIMTWCLATLKNLNYDVQRYFKLEQDSEDHALPLHQKLLATLDILTALSQFEQVRQYMSFYNGIEVIIDILRCLHENAIRFQIIRSTAGQVSKIKAFNNMGRRIEDPEKFKKRIDSVTGKINATNFPECKLLLVEVLSFLVFEQTKAQDAVREAGGLQLILSNCLIDDNDPFIKERCITCIKFLLQNNTENQNIVRDLEAQSVVQDDALEAAGLQVSLDSSGKLFINEPRE